MIEPTSPSPPISPTQLLADAEGVILAMHAEAKTPTRYDAEDSPVANNLSLSVGPTLNEALRCLWKWFGWPRSVSDDRWLAEPNRWVSIANGYLDRLELPKLPQITPEDVVQANLAALTERFIAAAAAAYRVAPPGVAVLPALPVIEGSPVMGTIRETLADHARAVFSVSELLCTTVDIEHLVVTELREDPNLRIAVVYETDDAAMRGLRAMRQMVGSAARDRNGPNNKHALTVRRSSFARDPSIQIIGCGGAIIGGRVDRIYIAHAFTYRSQRSSKARQKTWAWLETNVLSRVTEGGRIAVFGEPWHPDDVLHRLVRSPGWAARKLPLVMGGESVWPEKYPAEKITEMRRTLGPVEAARQIDLHLTGDVFQEAWIRLALDKGAEFDEVASIDEVQSTPLLPEQGRTITGVAWGHVEQRAVATILVYPSGIRQVLCLERGGWTDVDLLKRAEDHRRRYASVGFVETHAAQRCLDDVAKTSGLPFEFRTMDGANRGDPVLGVESIGVGMFQGRWWFPNDNGAVYPGMAQLLTELRTYNHDDGAGPCLTALWVADRGAQLWHMSAGAPAS